MFNRVIVKSGAVRVLGIPSDGVNSARPPMAAVVTWTTWPHGTSWMRLSVPPRLVTTKGRRSKCGADCADATIALNRPAARTIALSPPATRTILFVFMSPLLALLEAHEGGVRHRCVLLAERRVDP